MPKSQIFNEENMFLKLFPKIKFSRKFSNLQFLGKHMRFRDYRIDKQQRLRRACT